MLTFLALVVVVFMLPLVFIRPLLEKIGVLLGQLIEGIQAFCAEFKKAYEEQKQRKDGQL